jgi:hypothetical protein
VYEKLGNDLDSAYSKYAGVSPRKPEDAANALNVLDATKSIFSFVSLDYVSQACLVWSRVWQYAGVAGRSSPRRGGPSFFFFFFPGMQLSRKKYSVLLDKPCRLDRHIFNNRRILGLCLAYCHSAVFLFMHGIEGYCSARAHEMALNAP